MDTFAKRVKYARTEAGLSQLALAQRISELTHSTVGKALVSHWENGRVQRPNGTNLYAIERATGFRSRWILTGELPERLSEESAAGAGSDAPAFDKRALERAISAVFHDVPNVSKRSRAVVSVYLAMQLDPNTNPETLARLAESLLSV